MIISSSRNGSKISGGLRWHQNNQKMTKMDHFGEAPDGQKKSALAANNIFSPILAVISQKASDSATIRRDSAELGRRIGGGGG